MTKEDLIYDLLKSIDKKLDNHINNKSVHSGLSLKEWGIIGGIVTTVCTTVTAVVTILVQGGAS